MISSSLAQDRRQASAKARNCVLYLIAKNAAHYCYAIEMTDQVAVESSDSGHVWKNEDGWMEGKSCDSAYLARLE